MNNSYYLDNYSKGVVQLEKKSDYKPKLISDIRGDISGWWGKTFRDCCNGRGLAINNQAKKISILGLRRDNKKEYEIQDLIKNTNSSIWDHIVFGKEGDFVCAVEYKGIIHLAKIELKKRKILFRNSMQLNHNEGEITTLAACPRHRFLAYHTRLGTQPKEVSFLEVVNNKLKEVGSIEVKSFTSGYYKSMTFYGYFGKKLLLLGFDGIGTKTTIVVFSFDLDSFKIECLEGLTHDVPVNWANVVKKDKGSGKVLLGGDFAKKVEIYLEKEVKEAND